MLIFFFSGYGVRGAQIVFCFSGVRDAQIVLVVIKVCMYYRMCSLTTEYVLLLQIVLVVIKVCMYFFENKTI